jgi:hypothetical protein
MLMLPMGANAHCGGKHGEGHPHCSNVPGGGGGVIAENYSINITGEMGDDGGGADGFSAAMLDGDRKGVGGGSLDPGGFGLGITFDSIVAHFYNAAPFYCFPTHPVMGVGMPVTVSPQVGITKGKKGRAEAHIWFRGNTDPPDPSSVDPILYLLILIGTFDEDTKDVAWPPPPGGGAGSLKSMTMTTWETSVENQGAEIKSESCIAGPLLFPMEGEVHIDILGN